MEPQPDDHVVSARRGVLHNDYLHAAAVLALLLTIFFSPIARYDATFSAVANIQRLFYPWAGSQAVDRPDAPFYPQADHATYVHPRQVFLDRELKRNHEIPLWDPGSLGGTPFFAESGSRLAYPPLIGLTLLLSPSWLHDVYLILHLFVAGMAAFALMKQLQVRFAGALLTAIAWMLGSYTLSWIMLEMFAAIAAMLPLALLFVRRWYDRSSWVDLGVATLALGFLVLGATVDIALFGFLAVVGYAGALAAGRLVRDRARLGTGQRLRLVAAPAALAVGALALAAPAVLPFLQLSSRSLRISVPESMRSSVAPYQFLRAFVPPAIPSDFAEAWKALNGRQTFAGTVTAVLAILGLLARRRGAGLGRALVLGSFVFLAVTPVQQAVGVVLPVLGKLASPGRGLFLWDLGLAVLGGLGLDTLLRRMEDRAPLGDAPRRAIAAVVAVACLVVTSAQLLSYGRKVNPPFQRRVGSQLFPTTPAIEAIRGELGHGPGRGRVIALSTPGGEALVASTAMAVDLRVANGYETVTPANVSTLWRTVAGESPTEAATPTYLTFITRFDPERIRSDLLGRMGVAVVLGPPAQHLGPTWAPGALALRGLRPVYSGTDGTVFAVMDPAPRALVVAGAEWARTPQDALARLSDPSFDVRRNVVLQGAGRPPSEDVSRDSRGPGPSSVTWLEDGANRIRLSVTSATEGWLVVVDSWDPDWIAMVDGRETDVERANFGFRAVRVPAGTSTVTFTYRPTVALVGASLSLFTSLAIVAAVLGGWRRSRRPQR